MHGQTSAADGSGRRQWQTAAAEQVANLVAFAPSTVGIPFFNEVGWCSIMGAWAGGKLVCGRVMSTPPVVEKASFTWWARAPQRGGWAANGPN